MTAAPHARHAATRVGNVLVAVLAAGCWWAWFAWDTERTTDPLTGATSGPWAAWQVLGCGVCLVALVVVATRWLPAWLVVVTVPCAFTVAWSTTASGDGSGLWAVGAVLVLLGTAAGAALVALLAAAVRRRR